MVGGRLTQLRRGLYAQTALLGSLDPYAVAACLCTDSIIGYVAAINFHLFPDADTDYLHVITRERLGKTELRKVTYRGIAPPRSLHDEKDYGGSVMRTERQGVKVVISSLERAVVDCLDRADLFEFPELLRLWPTLSRFDVNEAIRYAVRLGNRVAIGRLGVMLESHPHHRPNTPAVFQLSALRPATPAPFDPRDRSKGQYLYSRWNIMVPDALLPFFPPR